MSVRFPSTGYSRFVLSSFSDCPMGLIFVWLEDECWRLVRKGVTTLRNTIKGFEEGRNSFPFFFLVVLRVHNFCHRAKREWVILECFREFSTMEICWLLQTSPKLALNPWKLHDELCRVCWLIVFATVWLCELSSTVDSRRVFLGKYLPMWAL